MKLRVRVIAALLALVPLVFPQEAYAKSIVELNGVVATGASPGVDTFGHKLIRAQIWSSAGSVATVLVQCRASSPISNPGAPVAPWYTVATITDPSAAGEYWSIPRSAGVRLNVSAWASGTIYGVVEIYND